MKHFTSSYDKVVSLRFSPNGNYLAFSIYSSGLDIVLVDTLTGSIFKKFTPYPSLSSAWLTSHGVVVDNSKGIYFIYTDSVWDGYLEKFDGATG